MPRAQSIGKANAPAQQVKGNNPACPIDTERQAMHLQLLLFDQDTSSCRAWWHNGPTPLPAVLSIIHGLASQLLPHGTTSPPPHTHTATPLSTHTSTWWPLKRCVHIIQVPCMLSIAQQAVMRTEFDLQPKLCKTDSAPTCTPYMCGLRANCCLLSSRHGTHSKHSVFAARCCCMLLQKSPGYKPVPRATCVHTQSTHAGHRLAPSKPCDCVPH